LALSAFWHDPALAQLTKINVGYSAISGDALPAWVAKEAGIFEKNGLDVQLVFFKGGTTAVMRWFRRTRRSLNWPDLL
jgi:ABC-type nitrate/sulfonate/bicarbonate transport system substrate-binding protein